MRPGEVVARAVAPAAQHHHLPGAGYIAVGVVFLIVGVVVGRLWDDLVEQALDLGVMVRRWFEIAGAVVLAGLIMWAILHWGLHAV